MSFGNEFKHKVVVVTGAGRGIGAFIASRLIEMGAEVIQLDLSFETLWPHQYELDVQDREAVFKLIERIEGDVGPVDFLVSAAGIFKAGSILEMEPEECQALFSVNFIGVVNITQAVARRMAKRKRGAIVVISSNAAKVPRLGMSAYPVSKAATTQYARCLGLELAQYQVRCNLVSPGSTLTPMQTLFWQDSGGDSDQVIGGDLSKYRLGIPLNKMAQPEDVCHSVLFFLSGQSRHLTMADLVVDGGATLS